MSTAKPLLDLLAEQEVIQEKLRQEVLRVDALDHVRRCEELEEKLAESKQALDALSGEKKQLAAENGQLKQALVSQAWARKKEDVSNAANQTHRRYKGMNDAHTAQLAALEHKYRDKINALQKELEKSRLQDTAALEAQLAECRKALDALLQRQRQVLNDAGARTFSEINRNYRQVEQEPLSEQEIKRMASRNNMELRLGGRVANILGLLLIVIGVVVGLQYTYTRLLTSPALKSAAAYLLGLLFLAGGELLGRKRRSAFSLGLTAGGVGILFAATAVSFFVLEVLGLYAAFGMCVLIAASALLLSLRDNSQVIANFALIGGFLPVSAVSAGGPVLLVLMVYLLMLNFFTLLLSARRDWRLVKFISLFFSTVTTAWIISTGGGGPALNLCYACVSFAIYMFIAILYPIRTGTAMDGGSFGVVVVNALANCAFVFGVLLDSGLDRWLGLAALCLGAFYYAFSHFLVKKLTNSPLPGLFLASALVFAVLVVPLQLDARWLDMGWLFEAAALIVVGMALREKWYIRIGGAAYGLSMLAFVLFERYAISGYFLMKFTAIVAASVFILGAGLWLNRGTEGYLYTGPGRYLRYFKHYLTVLAYSYLIYLSGQALRSAKPYNSSWDRSVLAALVSAGYAWALSALKKLRDTFTDGLSTALFVLAALLGFALNMFDYRYIDSALPLVPAFLLLNIAAVFAVFRCVTLSVRRGADPRMGPLVLFSYLLALILQALVLQARLSVSDMLLSFVLICAALLYILHGFLRQSSYTRRAGLGLAVAAVFKFFVVDLYFLSTGQRILSYFVLGAVLIGISFVYQHFARRVFELEGVTMRGISLQDPPLKKEEEAPASPKPESDAKGPEYEDQNRS